MDSNKKGNITAGYFCPYFPEELILAGGILPLRISPDGTTICPDCMHLDAIYIVKPLENRDRLKGYLANLPQTPVFCLELNTPEIDFDTQPKEQTAFKRELRSLKQHLGQFYGHKITRKDLQRSVALSGEIRENLRTIFEYPRRDNSPAEWRELFDFIRKGFLKDRSVFLREIKELEAALEQRAASAIPDDSRPRLMIAGSLLGDDDDWLVDVVIQSGGNIVSDCLCNGSMLLRKKVPHFGIIEDPLDIMVEQYLFNVPAPCMGNIPRRLNYILKTVRDFNIHGIIYYNRMDTCNAASDQAKTIKDRVYNALLVPTLIVEAKPADSREMIKGKVKSFIDIIGGRI